MLISHIEIISPDSVDKYVHLADQKVLERMTTVYFNTNFGHRLENYKENYLDTLDNRTSFIVIGDGKNIVQPPIKSLPIICPQGKEINSVESITTNLCGCGDNFMSKYAPHISCHFIYEHFGSIDQHGRSTFCEANNITI